jgi:predicted permease
LSGVAGYFPLVPASFAGNGEPERVWGQAVTTNFFDVTELGMVRGRGFESHEDQDPVVVVSAGLWQRRFHRDPELVGKTVTISGRAFTVVGIAPIAFHSVDQLFYAEFWVPIGNAAKMVPGFPDRSDRNAAYMWLVGRQRSGVTRADALAELNALAKRLALSYPTSGKDDTRRPVFIFLTALGIVVLLVLSIAACNVANLMFVQAIGRQREMAVRLALGATRGCLRRQMLVESVLLGLGGGIAGILLSLWSMQALSTFHLPTAFPLDMRIGIDWRVVFATFILCILSGLLLGAAPAWAATRPQLMNALKGEDALARPARRLTLRKLLTVAQIAMSVILLSMTGLFLRSLQSASHIDIGFRSHGLLMMSFDPQVHGYTPQRTVAFLDLLSERVGALPAVVSTTCTDNAPLSMVGNRSSFHVIGVQDVGKSKVNAGTYMVMPDYFETMGIPRLAGRDFGSEDVTGSKTAIINETFAKRLVGWGNPIGLQISDGKGVYEIIGAL